MSSEMNEKSTPVSAIQNSAVSSYKDKDLIGECGWFHGCLGTAVYFMTVVGVWGLMFMVFGLYNPGWTCLDEPEPSTNASAVLFVSSTSSLALPTNLAGQHKPNATWSLDCSIKQSCLNPIYDPQSSTVVTEWDLSCDRAWIPSMFISIQMAGALLGSCIIGQVGDRFGRKIGLFSTLALHGATHLAAYFSTSWQMYAVICFLIGVSVGGIFPCTNLYTLEFVSEWWRGCLVSIPVWSAGFITYSLGVFILRDWRSIHVTATILTLIVSLNVLWTPESIRWLAVKGKVDKSKEILSKIARINKHPPPDTGAIDAIAREERTRMGGHVYSYIDLFRISAFRALSIKYTVIWFSVGYSYYVISFGVKALYGDFYINLLISSVLEFPGKLLIFFPVNILGRRKSALLFTWINMTCCIMLVVLSFATSGRVHETSILVLALMAKMVLVGEWSIFTLFSAELYPTVIRSTVFGYGYIITGLSALVSPYLIPDNPSTIYVCFIVVGILGLIKSGLLWTLPETKGRVMEDTVPDVNVGSKTLSKRVGEEA